MWPFRQKRSDKPVLTPEQVMRATGLSERELTKKFMEHLIEQGKNPFTDMPEPILRKAHADFPDLAEIARKKFGGPSTAPHVKTGSQRVPRDWDNLPSVVMTPVPRGFSYATLSQSIRKQAPDKQLVSLVEWGWTVSQAQALEDIQRLYEFEDDPKLVVMRFPGDTQIIIRASFMHDTAKKIIADTLASLATALLREANARGLKTTTVQRT